MGPRKARLDDKLREARDPYAAAYREHTAYGCLCSGQPKAGPEYGDGSMRGDRRAPSAVMVH
jgi:hypothetical protein